MNAYAFAGTFTIVGASPDGDTVRFRPDRPRHLAALTGAERIAWSKQGTVSVRLEGIDAPELHYAGQCQRRGAHARATLLRRLGFDGAPEARGWIVASSADTHGRIIAFTFGASDRRFDEGPLTFDGALARASANAHMLASGAAYALFYASLRTDLRRTLRAIALAARTARRGVWSNDATRAFELRSLGSVGTRGALVMPKLFRRCVTYCLDGVRASASAFVDWLRATRAHDDVVSSDGRRLRMSALLSAERGRVRMTADPMWLVFDPKGG